MWECMYSTLPTGTIYVCLCLSLYVCEVITYFHMYGQVPSTLKQLLSDHGAADMQKHLYTKKYRFVSSLKRTRFLSQDPDLDILSCVSHFAIPSISNSACRLHAWHNAPNKRMDVRTVARTVAAARKRSGWPSSTQMPSVRVSS